MNRIQALPLSRWARARVEYAIGTIKRLFHFTKVRYRGLAKNGNRLFVAAALAKPSFSCADKNV